MTKTEHIEWSKNRAIEYAKQDDLIQAWVSFVSDMMKHDEIKNEFGDKVFKKIIHYDNLSTKKKMIKFIQDY